MSDSIFSLYRRLLFVGIMIVISLFLLSFIFSATKTNSSRVRAEANTSASAPDSPNVITSGMVAMLDNFSQITDSAIRTIHAGVTSIGSATASSSKLVVHKVGNVVSSAGQATGKSISAVSNIPGNALEVVVNNDVLTNVIRPNDNVEVPIIDPNSPELQAALASLPSENGPSPSLPNGGTGPAWPIHGRITAEFGENHHPYQYTHTGIDISDRQPAGTTPVKPFRPGKVVETIRSMQGLGNHVIVDHGNGVTSVYAHLNSISVDIGQEVNLTTTLGFVGTTGASTGPHLHLEIRVNGKAANPKQFISGLPS